MKLVLDCLRTLAGILIICYIVRAYINAVRRRPRLQKTDIVYQEWFASGVSERNILTRQGGAHNCLRLVVTHDVLWVTSWPFLTLLAVTCDLDHVIPLHSIKQVERSRKFRLDTLLLTYANCDNELVTLRLVPRHKDKFLHSLGVDVA